MRKECRKLDARFTFPDWIDQGHVIHVPKVDKRQQQSQQVQSGLVHSQSMCFIIVFQDLGTRRSAARTSLPSWLKWDPGPHRVITDGKLPSHPRPSYFIEALVSNACGLRPLRNTTRLIVSIGPDCQDRRTNAFIFMGKK